MARFKVTTRNSTIYIHAEQIQQMTIEEGGKGDNVYINFKEHGTRVSESDPGVKELIEWWDDECNRYATRNDVPF